MTKITVAQRQAIATRFDISDAYLYQCLTGRRDMGPVEARRLERVTGGELRRWDLCHVTWGDIWPELIAEPGAPDFEAGKAAALALRAPNKATPEAEAA